MTRRGMIDKLKSWAVRVFWSRRYQGDSVRTWLAEPAVRRYVNDSVTGSQQWPIDWFQERYGADGFPRAVSLGCGDGPLERDVIGKAMCDSILGLDISAAAIDRARVLAREAGLAGLEYEVGDLDHLALPAASFDIVFFHQALHHVADLEGCLDEVRRALRPGGLLYLDEYVGPSRGEWRRPLIAAAEEVFGGLPGHLKRRRRLALPVDWRDPSEAIRSSEILAEVEKRFAVRERRDYGGNLLSVIHPHLIHERLAEPEGERALATIIAAEKELLAAGAGSYYCVWVGG